MRKCPTRLQIGTACLALAAPCGLAAQQPTPPTRPQEEPYVVGQALPPVDEGKTLLPLTLEEAIEQALESNLDIQTARLDPTIQEYALDAARSAFSPTVQVSYGYTDQTRQSTSQLDGGARTSSARQTLNTSLAKTMPWYGGRLSMDFNNSRIETNNSFTTLNPSYTSSLSLNYSQPLLAGLRADNQRAGLETERIRSQIVDLQVQTQVANITYQVRQAYWGLRATIEQIEIQRRSLAQAQQLYDENQIRVQLGRMTDLQLVQSEAQVASAQQNLLNAEIQWRNQEFAFKRLLLSGADDPLLEQTINPTDEPQIIDQEVDIDAAIQTALEERNDIVAQREQRQISVVNLDVSEAAAKPDLTFTAGYSLQGVGGNLFQRDQLGGDPVLLSSGGYWDGIRSIGKFETPTWNVGLTASYPLGSNSNEANMERARLQLRQADLALKSQELAILTQVTNAGLAIRNSYLQYEAARRNREAAERSAEAERLRYGAGVATNFEVVTGQNQLTTARLAELQAIINHVNAVAEFERVQHIGG